MDRKLRILCLHGMAQNEVIFRKKTAVIRKKLDKIADLGKLHRSSHTPSSMTDLPF
jgi:hypothetical protein